MSAMKEIHTEIQCEMWNVVDLLNMAAEDGDAEVMFDCLVECTAKLAVLTRRYHGVHS